MKPCLVWRDLGQVENRGTRIFWKALAVKAVAVGVAACLWLPCIHLFFAVDTADYRQEDGIAPKARMLAERHLAIWRDPVLRAQELEAMGKVYEQQQLAEWGADQPGQTLQVKLTDDQRKNVHAETGVWLDVVEFEDGNELQSRGMPEEYPQIVEYQAIQVAKRRKANEEADMAAKTAALENIAAIRQGGGKEANDQLDQLLKDPNFMDGLLK